LVVTPEQQHGLIVANLARLKPSGKSTPDTTAENVVSDFVVGISQEAERQQVSAVIADCPELAGDE
jgi:hypothetical protein